MEARTISTKASTAMKTTQRCRLQRAARGVILEVPAYADAPSGRKTGVNKVLA